MLAAGVTALGCLFFNDPRNAVIYTLSLHDALPIWVAETIDWAMALATLGRSDLDEHTVEATLGTVLKYRDRKSTRLNSSHANISYAVFCLKKKLHITLACGRRSLQTGQRASVRNVP